MVAADGAPAAYAQLDRSAVVFDPRIWTAPAHRGIGIEAALLRRTQERAREVAHAEGAACLKLFAQATSTNPSAQHALADAGFRAVDTYDNCEKVIALG